jgi:hypothetical protein
MMHKDKKQEYKKKFELIHFLKNFTLRKTLAKSRPQNIHAQFIAFESSSCARQMSR